MICPYCEQGEVLAAKLIKKNKKILVLVKKWVGKYSIIYTASKLCVAMSFTV